MDVNFNVTQSKRKTKEWLHGCKYTLPLVLHLQVMTPLTSEKVVSAGPVRVPLCGENKY